MALLVILAEAAVAAALLCRPTARLGALGGVLLALAFLVVSTARRVAGDTSPCNCYGNWLQLPPNGMLAVQLTLLALSGHLLLPGRPVDAAPSERPTRPSVVYAARASARPT